MSEAKKEKKGFFGSLFRKKESVEEEKAAEKKSEDKKDAKPEVSGEKPPEVTVSKPRTDDNQSIHSQASQLSTASSGGQKKANKKYASFSQLLNEPANPEPEPEKPPEKPKFNLLALSTSNDSPPQPEDAKKEEKAKSPKSPKKKSPKLKEKDAMVDGNKKREVSPKRSPKKKKSPKVNKEKTPVESQGLVGPDIHNDEIDNGPTGGQAHSNHIASGNEGGESVEPRPNHGSDQEVKSGTAQKGVDPASEQEPAPVIMAPVVKDTEPAPPQQQTTTATNDQNKEQQKPPENEPPKEEKKSWFGSLFSKKADEKPAETPQEPAKEPDKPTTTDTTDSTKDTNNKDIAKDTTNKDTPNNTTDDNMDKKPPNVEVTPPTADDVKKDNYKDTTGRRSPKGERKRPNDITTEALVNTYPDEGTRDRPRRTQTNRPPSINSLDGDPPPSYRSRHRDDDRPNTANSHHSGNNKPPLEEKHLRTIWKDLGIGKNGYLTMSELSLVCRHIGMTNMAEKELKELFANLDTDHDHRVSFNEFMHGLFQYSPKDYAPPNSHRKPRHSKPGVINGEAGMFSAIDFAGMGYARPSDLIEYWNKIGIRDGAALLQQLNFDTKAAKLSLGDLSRILEAELVQDDHHRLHCVAVLSAQHEINNLKFLKGQVELERDAYRSDLIHANGKIAQLTTDGNAKDAMEEKYEEEIRLLNQEIEELKDGSNKELIQQRRSMENVIIKLKEEETLLKERLADYKYEIDRLEKDVRNARDDAGYQESLNSNMERELESIAELHAKIKIDLASISNTEELRDANDELIMEVEMLRQQKKEGKEPMKHFNLHDKLKKDFDFLKKKYHRDTKELQDKLDNAKDNYELELKDEIADIEDHYEKKIEEILQGYKVEKENLHNEFERQKAELEANVRKDMEDRHRTERELYVSRMESDKMNMEQKHDLDKASAVKQLEKDYQDELRRRMDGIRDTFDRERTEKLDDWETQKRLIREELTLQFSKETQAMRERFMSDKARMEEIHKLEIQEYDNMLQKGEQALSGKLRDDFEIILEENRQKIRHDEASQAKNKYLREKTQLEEDHNAELARVRLRERQAFADEKREMERKYERLIAKYEAEAAQLPTRNQLEDEFQKRLDNAKLAFASEAEILKERTRNLEDRLSEKDMSLAMSDTYKKKADEFTRRNKQLEDEVRRAVEENEHLKSRLRVIEDRANKLSKELDDIKWKYDLRMGDINEKLEQVENMKTKNDQLYKDKEELEKSIMDIEDIVNTKDREIGQLKDTNTKLTDQLNQTSRNLDSRVKELQYKSDEVNRLKNEKASLDTEKREVASNCESVQSKLYEIELGYQTVQTEKATVDMERRELARNYESTKNRLKATEMELDALRQEKDALTDDHRELNRSCEGLKARLRETELDLKSCQDLLHDVKNDMDIAKSSHSNQSGALRDENNRLKRDLLQESNRVEAMEQEKNVLKQHLKHANDQITDLTERLTKTEQEHLKDLQEARDRLAGYVDMNKFNECSAKLYEAEKRIEELEEALNRRSKDFEATLRRREKENEETIKRLQNEKDESLRRLDKEKDETLKRRAKDSEEERRRLAKENEDLLNRRAKENEEILQKRVKDSTRLFEDAQTALRAALKEAEEDNETTKKKLEVTKEMLKEKVDALKQEMEENRRASRMAEDLFKENARLTRAMELSEDQMKKNEAHTAELEQKCHALQRCLKKMVREGDDSFIR